MIDQVGNLRSRNEAQVSSRIMAQVKEILVREGDRVVGSDENDKPTILARLDDRDIQAKLRQAQSQSAAMDRAVEVARAKAAAARAQVESTLCRQGKGSLRLPPLPGPQATARRQPASNWITHALRRM